MKCNKEYNTPGHYAGQSALRQGVLRKPGRNAPRRPPLCKRRVRCWNCRGSSLHMGRAAVIWPESCLSHREGANVSDFKNVSRCSKVKVKIEWKKPNEGDGSKRTEADQRHLLSIRQCTRHRNIRISHAGWASPHVVYLVAPGVHCSYVQYRRASSS